MDDAQRQLDGFIDKFTPENAALTRALLDRMKTRIPGAAILVYDNYNALAVGWSPTDRVGHTFCSIAVGRSSGNVHFGFYWGSQIADPKRILLGEGNQYRYVLVKDKEDFPKAYLQKLMKEAYANSLAKVKDKKQIMHGATITKSISSRKRSAKRVSTAKKK